MPGGRTKFQAKWLDVKDGNGDLIGNWCNKNEEDEYNAYCSSCKCPISISNSGISQILQHASRQKHRSASKLLRGQKRLNTSDSISKDINTSKDTDSRSLSLSLTMQEMATKAEALWAMKIAVANFSFTSCKDVVPLFREMFSGNPVASAMHLSDRKVSYVISHGLGPFFHSQLVSDLKKSIGDGGFFSLTFDETTTAQAKKQLDFYVRFWSFADNKVVSAYFTSVFLGHAEAEIICNAISKILEDEKIALTRVLMLGMDGPNVNLLVEKKINEELGKLGAGRLVNVDTCSLHKVHNCFSKAIDSLPLDIDEMATDFFSFFRLSPARKEDLLGVEKLLECEQKFLLRHVTSRWLTLGPVVARIIEIYPALQSYFLDFLPKKKSGRNTLQSSARYKRIVHILKDPTTLVYLEFVASLAPNLQTYLTLFQTEAPLVHIIYSKMCELFRVIILKFIKEDCVHGLNEKDLIDLDLDNFENYSKDLDVGMGALKASRSLEGNEAKNVKRAMRSCLKTLAECLKKTLPFSNSLLRDLAVLHPITRDTETNNAVRRLCLGMKPLNFDYSRIDSVLAEWQTYRFDPNVKKIADDFLAGSNLRIDLFWRSVFSLKDIHNGKNMYNNLAFFVKNCLILSHGNSDVERGFSLNNNIVTDMRTNMSESSVIGLRNVKDHVKRHGGDILSVPISGQLLQSVVKSHAAYNMEREAIKKAAEEEARKKASEENLKKERGEAEKLKLQKEEKITELIKIISRLHEEIASANKCVAEGNERLQKALKGKKRDFTSMNIAATMIEAGTSNIEKLTGKLTSAQQKLNLLQSS